MLRNPEGSVGIARNANKVRVAKDFKPIFRIGNHKDCGSGPGLVEGVWYRFYAKKVVITARGRDASLLELVCTKGALP
jgi:hypothetical protein